MLVSSRQLGPAFDALDELKKDTDGTDFILPTSAYYIHPAGGTIQPNPASQYYLLPSPKGANA